VETMILACQAICNAYLNGIEGWSIFMLRGLINIFYFTFNSPPKYFQLTTYITHMLEKICIFLFASQPSLLSKLR
jgi:hypothetical protein